ncbi:MAG TPA: hypothetical protein VE641_17435, partial [Chthoniobacterales bacterium]|nr:hypothetical protein [Chthoniobacterales bacterium]
MVFVVAIYQLTNAKGPQWLPPTFENPYNYLFNSLVVVDGRAPVYTDHPGTTTEIFGAIILRISSFKSGRDLIYSALSHPEAQIERLHWALLIFSALILWIVPWLTALAVRSHIAGILIQAPCLFSKTLVFYGTLFGSDLMVVPFSVAAVCCCLLLMFPSSVPEKLEFLFAIRVSSPNADSPRLRRVPVLLIPALTGLVCAFGMATKLTFFPLILVSLLCCRSRNNLLAFSVSFIFGLAFALLPIYRQLWRLANWAVGLVIHRGIYATGEVGLPQSNVHLSSLSNLIKIEPLVLVIPLVVTVLFLTFSLRFRKQAPGRKITRKTALALLAIQVFSLFTIAKEMGPHYLIPLFVTTGLSLVFLFQACRSIEGPKLTKTVGWIGLFVLLALGSKSFISETSKKLAELREQKVELLRLYRHAEEVTKNDVRVDYFFSDSPVYPLCYGDDYADRAYAQLLARMYPNALFLNVFSAKFES